MEWIIWLLVVTNVALVAYFVWKGTQGPDAAADTQGFMLLQGQLQDLSRAMENKLGEGTTRMFESMRSQFDQSQRLMSDITDRVSLQLLEVTKGVVETRESTKQVFTIAEQLSNLEKVLKNQKQRGNLGEASLELVLSNVLPPGQFVPQYQFENGDAVDMVVRTIEGLIPVDAKFPLENYVRLVDELDEGRKEQYRKDFKSDVKKRIDETSKYIRPEEGTMPFAFMYIPSEAIYYDLLNNDVGVGVNSRDLIEYAYKEKHVIIASPTTFLAYLQTVLYGNQRAKIQEAAKDIIKHMSELNKHLSAYQESHNKLGKSLSQAVGHFETSGKSFRQIAKDVARISQEDTIELSLEAVERPMLEGRE